MAVATHHPAGWIFDPTPEHRCILPSGRELDRHLKGAIWRCGACGKEWEVATEQVGQADQICGVVARKILREAT